MILSRPHLIILAAGGSALLMLGAFGFQYIGHMAPCKMCYWQRYPHVVAIVIGVLALMVPGRALPALGAIAALTTAGIGVFHTGVERGYWAGPTSCSGTGAPLSSQSISDLLSTQNAPPIVMCDQVAWEMLTLSMASWNALASFGLAFVWLLACRNRV